MTNLVKESRVYQSDEKDLYSCIYTILQEFEKIYELNIEKPFLTIYEVKVTGILKNKEVVENDE